MRAPGEQGCTRAEFDDAVRRIKAVERELDDLHAAYRRLRASRAAEEKGKLYNPEAPKEGERGEPVIVEPARSRKDELRRRLLSTHRRINGPTEQTE